MPIYVVLYKWTDQAIREVKDTLNRNEESLKLAEALGVKALGVYYTMGEYDVVAIGEAPNDEAATALVLATGSRGYTRTTVLKAFTPEEFSGILDKLP